MFWGLIASCSLSLSFSTQHWKSGRLYQPSIAGTGVVVLSAIGRTHSSLTGNLRFSLSAVASEKAALRSKLSFASSEMRLVRRLVLVGSVRFSVWIAPSLVASVLRRLLSTPSAFQLPSRHAFFHPLAPVLHFQADPLLLLTGAGSFQDLALQSVQPLVGFADAGITASAAVAFAGGGGGVPSGPITPHSKNVDTACSTTAHGRWSPGGTAGTAGTCWTWGTRATGGTAVTAGGADVAAG